MAILSLIIGYLLGSISPAYILGRLVKGVDIRKVGDGNAGTTNVYHELGLLPAVITAIYDVLKGLLSMFIAYKMGVPEVVIYCSGLAAALGHIFPFYLGFKGGQGSATLVGMLFYFLFVLFRDHFLPLESLAILAIVIFSILYITKQKLFLALITMPAMVFILYKNYHFNLVFLFTSIILVYFFFLNVYLSYQEKIFVLKRKTLESLLPWRTLMRPLAIVFPIAYFYLPKKDILWTLGILATVFIALDLLRLGSQKINFFFFEKIRRIFKKREKKRFSSISLFLFSAFVVILIFPKEIAIASLLFLIFGDVFAKFFGLEYGKTKIFGDKTLEGSIAHGVACLLCGYLLLPYTSLSVTVIMVGVFVATIVEALPLGINDNFSVSLISALAMYGVERFI